jgi:hypothetical protein
MAYFTTSLGHPSPVGRVKTPHPRRRLLARALLLLAGTPLTASRPRGAPVRPHTRRRSPVEPARSQLRRWTRRTVRQSARRLWGSSSNGSPPSKWSWCRSRLLRCAARYTSSARCVPSPARAAAEALASGVDGRRGGSAAQKKVAHVAAKVARAELGFCQHVAHRAAPVALREWQAAPLAALSAACGTLMDWVNHTAALCTVADGQRVSSTLSRISPQLRHSAVVREPPLSPGVSHSRLSPSRAGRAACPNWLKKTRLR